MLIIYYKTDQNGTFSATQKAAPFGNFPHAICWSFSKNKQRAVGLDRVQSVLYSFSILGFMELPKKKKKVLMDTDNPENMYTFLRFQ